MAVKLRGVIFDLDGTLADTLPICISAFRDAVLGAGGRSYTDDEVTALFGPTEEGMLRHALAERWEEAMPSYLRLYEQAHDACTEPFAGIDAVLRTLQSRGVSMAVVTGKGPHSAEISLRRLCLITYFDLVEAGSPDGPIKPAAIRRVLDHWNIPAAEVAYVGDVPTDMDAAAEVGVVGLGAAWAATSTLRAAPASAAAHTFTTVDTFARWIADHT